MASLRYFDVCSDRRSPQIRLAQRRRRSDEAFPVGSCKFAYKAMSRNYETGLFHRIQSQIEAISMSSWAAILHPFIAIVSFRMGNSLASNCSLNDSIVVMYCKKSYNSLKVNRCDSHSIKNE